MNMLHHYYVKELVNWTSSLKLTIQNNQFSENNRISTFAWGSALQVIIVDFK